jgi:hypothetical protein
VVLGALAAWALLDVLRLTSLRELQTGAIVWGIAMVFLAFGLRYRGVSMRRAGIILLGTLYFGLHVIRLPLDLAAALAFLTLLFVYVELRVLVELFAPIYARDLTPEARARIRGGLGRALLRLFGAASMAYLVPVFAEDLAVAGTVPTTTIPTAILLAAAFVAVVVVLALLPRWEERLGSRLPIAGRAKER